MVGHPRADDMQRSQRLGRVERMPQRLPVNGHHLQAIGLLVVGHTSIEPVEEACLKGDRFDFSQERSDAVATRCFSLWQINPCLQPVLLGAGPPRNRFGV